MLYIREASRKDDPVQADEFALFVQIVTDIEFLVADLVGLRQEVRKIQKSEPTIGKAHRKQIRSEAESGIAALPNMRQRKGTQMEVPAHRKWVPNKSSDIWNTVLGRKE